MLLKHVNANADHRGQPASPLSEPSKPPLHCPLHLKITWAQASPQSLAGCSQLHFETTSPLAGANIAFVANIGGTAHTYIFDQIGNTPNTNNDILVDLVGVTLTSLGGANLAPAGVAGEAINLSLTNPANYLGSITLNVSGVSSGWTISKGTDNGDGTWSVQTNDVSALSITAPENYAGAVSLQNIADLDRLDRRHRARNDY